MIYMILYKVNGKTGSVPMVLVEQSNIQWSVYKVTLN